MSWMFYIVALYIWLPIALYGMKKKNRPLLAWWSSAVISVVLMVTNGLYSREVVWVVYTVAPLLIWPITISLGKEANSDWYTTIGSVSMISYYILLNIFYEKGFPWAVFTTYGILLWPLIRYGIVKRKPVHLSVLFTVMTSVFFIVTNWITSPQVIWAIYPIAGILWWPLATIIYQYLPLLEKQQ